MVTRANGTAERVAALELVERHTKRSRITLGADKVYDVKAGEIRLDRLPIYDADQGDGKIPGAEGGDFTEVADPEERHPVSALGLGLVKKFLAIVSGEAFSWTAFSSPRVISTSLLAA